MKTANSRWVLRTTGAAALMVLLAAPLPAQKRAGRHARRAGHGWFMRKEIQEALQLTPEQIKALERERMAYVERIRSPRKAVRVAYRKLVNLMGDEKAGGAALEAARREVEKAMTEVVRDNLDHLQVVRRILTTEQWRRLPEVSPRALRLGMSMTIMERRFTVTKPRGGEAR